MKITRLILPFSVLLLLSLACRLTASDSPPAPDSPTQASATPTTLSLPTTVAYKTVAGIDPDLLSLDIHVPADARNAPVVMWVHGGGYAIGDKAYQMTDKISLFNGQGWILVSVNYRLSAPDKGAAQYPDHFLDVAAAVAWVREHIPAYGGDPNRIALLGHSAGADIVSNVAVGPSYL